MNERVQGASQSCRCASVFADLALSGRDSVFADLALSGRVVGRRCGSALFALRYFLRQAKL